MPPPRDPQDLPESLDPSTWVRLHGRVLFAYARARLWSDDAAEDAVQETLLAAIASASSFDHRSQVRTWLVGILRHKVLDMLRARGREATVSSLADSVVPFVKGRWRETPRDAGGGLDQHELDARLRTALDELSEPMRSVVVLREIERLPGKVVCEILDLKPTNMWMLAHRGKLRLRSVLEADGPMGSNSSL